MKRPLISGDKPIPQLLSQGEHLMRVWHTLLAPFYICTCGRVHIFMHTKKLLSFTKN